MPPASLAVVVKVTMRLRLDPAGTLTADTLGGVVSAGGGVPPPSPPLLQAPSRTGNKIRKKRV